MNKRYLVRMECGAVQGKGGQASVPCGAFDDFEEAKAKLWRVANLKLELGYRTVMIAERNENGSYSAGPYRLNVVYSVTDTQEIGTAGRPSKQGVWR